MTIIAALENVLQSCLSICWKVWTSNMYLGKIFAGLGDFFGKSISRVSIHLETVGGCDPFGTRKVRRRSRAYNGLSARFTKALCLAGTCVR